MTAPVGTKCDKCSRLVKSGATKDTWTACKCPDGPVRQPLPTSWRMRGGT